MDFGTICSNLESGCKYKNSEHVYKDVQYIWENCCKYNNKGDYIVDLMRRVKKNFMKYWAAAGLFNEQARGMTVEFMLTVESILICFNMLSFSVFVSVFFLQPLVTISKIQWRNLIAT